MRPGKPFLFLATTLIALAAVSTSAQQMYRWVDENGRVQYSDRPPPANARTQKQVKVKPTSKPQTSTETAPAATAAVAKTPAEQEAEFRQRQVEKTEKEAAEQKAQQQAAETKANCDRARTRLAGMQSGARVSRYNAKGELEYLDDAQITQEMAQAQRSVADWCKG